MDPVDQLRSHFTGLRLREEAPAGRVYAGQDAAGSEVTIAVLAGAAATDPVARNAFAEVVWRHSIGAMPDRATVTSADLHAVFPWAATRAPAGQAGAEQLLAGVAGPPGAPVTPAPDAPASPAPDAPASPAPDAPASPAPGATASPAPAVPAAGAPARGSRLARLNRPGSPWPWLLGAAGGVLLVLVAAAAIAGLQALRTADPGPPGAGPTAGPPVEPPAGPDQADPDLPQLREVEAVSVRGPTFGPDERSDTMAFVGWPFAFRTPPGWICFEERLEQVPDGEFYQCEDDRGGDQLVAILLWECPTTCTGNEQQEMLGAWLQQPEFAVRLDPAPTSYVETGRNRDGYYTVELGHFAAAEPGGPLRWLVGVYLEAPVETRADVQKIMNDVISQSSR